MPGNTALRENWKRHHGRTLGLFCFDAKFLSRSDFSHNRFAFFLSTLKALKQELISQGGDLLIVDGQPQDVFPSLLEYCRSKQLALPSLISWNRDYEPFARQRDAKIETLLKHSGIDTFHSRDHLLFEPDEVLKSSKPGDFYQVYSPYGKKWFSLLASPEGQTRLAEQKVASNYFKMKERPNDTFLMTWKDLTAHGIFPFEDQLEQFTRKNQKEVTIPIPPAGFTAAFSELIKFKAKIADYKHDRDYPALRGTSRLSIFLKNGSLTPSQIIHELGLAGASWFQDRGDTQYVRELAWREFYYSILYHRPEVETTSFLPQYQNLSWENNPDLFESWKSGQTGFPIVDAGMRELKTTGWMHNRVRMIVASFLTKDLLIDWRWGENHFMKELLDGDLAANNGGWQWAASTGCDPQPYFRIFNPWLQGKKFDPEGSYIKTYVPELSQAPASALHSPDADRSLWNYPAPIVDHSVQRQKALRLYKGGPS